MPSREEVERWKLTPGIGRDPREDPMQFAEDGDWVRFEDHRERLEEAELKLVQLTEKFEEARDARFEEGCDECQAREGAAVKRAEAAEQRLEEAEAQREEDHTRLGEVREKLKAEVEHQEAISLTTDQEAMHSGAEGNFDAEREARLIVAIAENSLRKLRPILDSLSSECSNCEEVQPETCFNPDCTQPQPEDCGYCDGRGWIEGVGDHCTPDGEYIGSEPIQEHCPACNGTGKRQPDSEGEDEDDPPYDEFGCGGTGTADPGSCTGCPDCVNQTTSSPKDGGGGNAGCGAEEPQSRAQAGVASTSSTEDTERCPTCLSRNPWFTHCKDPGQAEQETGRTPPPLSKRGPSCSDPWHDQTQPNQQHVDPDQGGKR